MLNIHVTSGGTKCCKKFILQTHTNKIFTSAQNTKHAAYWRENLKVMSNKRNIKIK